LKSSENLVSEVKGLYWATSG